MTDDLERQLEEARQRLEEAGRRLAPRHQGGEWQDYQAAYERVHSLGLQLAMARGEEYAVPLDFPVQWDTGAPMPHLLANDLDAFLIFYVRVPDPGWDGTYVRIRDLQADQPLAVVQFHGCQSAKIGAPNDEVLAGHPLWERGLRGYTAQVVEKSRWIRELEAINKVHDLYNPAAWTRLRHFVFWFHDSTFECVAQSFEVEVRHETMPQVLARVCETLVR